MENHNNLTRDSTGKKAPKLVNQVTNRTSQPKTKPVKSTRPKKGNQLKEFLSEAMNVRAPSPIAAFMDSTSIIEIGVMRNEKYSQELFNRAGRVFDLERLDALKTKKFAAYLEEGKKQVIELWSCGESFGAHTDVFRTMLLICIGRILNDVEKAHSKKADYMNWLRANFGHKHMRYFQQAKELDSMGDFAKRNLGFAKNRLLEFKRTRDELGVSFEALFNRFKLQDTTEDPEGMMFKKHVDGIITFHRLEKAGLKADTDFDYEQAVLMAAQSNGAITVATAKKISDWLKDKEDKKQHLDDLILDKMEFPNDATTSKRAQSIKMHLANLISYGRSADLNNIESLNIIREQVSETEISQAYTFIVNLASKLGINLETSQSPA